MNITVGEENLIVSIEYGKGQKVVIEMDPFGYITVKAPKGTSEEVVVEHVQGQAEQLLARKRLLEAHKEALTVKEKVYMEGEQFLYLGKEYPITITVDEKLAKNVVDFDGKVLHIQAKNGEQETLKEALRRFYFRACKKMVVNRIAVYQPEFQVKPRVVDVVESSTNWGSCNTQRTITFNWRLMMAPIQVIDYIVIHEMCHLVHMNHDRSFWRLVGKLMPDYEKNQAWLAYKSPTMTL